MAVQSKLMTVQEFWEGYAGKPYELIHGEVVEIVPTGYMHGAAARRISSLLGDFVDQHQLGDVVNGETGFQLGPDTMRAADVAFIGKDKLATVTHPEKYLPFAPDLAVEVVSPGNTASEIQLKVTLYLDAGCRMVVTIYPDLRQIITYEPGGRSTVIMEDGVFDGGDVLPGLSIRVGEVFPSHKKSPGK
jgi:Uma2 family endonuclease